MNDVWQLKIRIGFFPFPCSVPNTFLVLPCLTRDGFSFIVDIKPSRVIHGSTSNASEHAPPWEPSPSWEGVGGDSDFQFGFNHRSPRREFLVIGSFCLSLHIYTTLTPDIAD